MIFCAGGGRCVIKAHGMVGVGFKVEVLEEERERTTSGDIEKDISPKKRGGGG